jgi:DNA-binding NarL/FixJ family response regulator
MSRRLRVLLVVDRPLLRENLISALEELAPVDVAATTASESQAMSLLTALQPLCDLVITDVPLAEGSGIGLLRRMQRMEIRCPVVVLTSVATPIIRARAAELGAERLFDVANEFDELIRFAGTLAASKSAADP